MATGLQQGPLTGPVGARGARNDPEDVKVVQYLFNALPGPAPKFDENGVCGLDLLTRISQFQTIEMRYPKADARIDPGGKTLRDLVQKAAMRPGGMSPAAYMPFNGYRSRAEAAVQAALAQAIKADKERKELTKGTGAAGGTLTDADFRDAATRLGPGIKPELVRAFAKVESGGRSGFGPAGLPVIAYEGHWFRKFTDRVYDQTHPLLSYKYAQKAGPEWRTNNADQTKAWETIATAAALNYEAALKACSWGMFQVMGFNHHLAGYSNVQDFVSDMKRSERGQLDAFVGFCKKTPGMVKALTERNYIQMATLYNGEDYGDYPTRIEKFYKQYTGG